MVEEVKPTPRLAMEGGGSVLITKSLGHEKSSGRGVSMDHGHKWKRS